MSDNRCAHPSCGFSPGADWVPCTREAAREHAPFGYDSGVTPEVFIQWKGTDVCFDFACDCGWSGHFDGYFAYLVKCGGCGQVWELPWHIYPRKSERADSMPTVEPEPHPDA